MTLLTMLRVFLFRLSLRSKLVFIRTMVGLYWQLCQDVFVVLKEAYRDLKHIWYPKDNFK
jgi:hypothetical protein